MAIKYEEDFILCSNIEAAMGLVPNMHLPKKDVLKPAVFNNDFAKV